jgi:hypothetical protein
MKKQVICSLIIVTALALISIGVALAHGTPVITVQPAIVAAGGQITCVGTEMAAGETFTMTLEGASGSTYLGTVTASANMDQSSMSTPQAESKATPDNNSAQSGAPQEGGFSVAYTIPDKTPPGSYTVKATAEDGDATTTDLTITAASAQASAAPAMIQEPTGALHQIDRSKPTVQVVGVVIVAITASALGLWLVRKR